MSLFRYLFVSLFSYSFHYLSHFSSSIAGNWYSLFVFSPVDDRHLRCLLLLSVHLLFTDLLISMNSSSFSFFIKIIRFIFYLVLVIRHSEIIYFDLMWRGWALDGYLFKNVNSFGCWRFEGKEVFAVKVFEKKLRVLLLIAENGFYSGSSMTDCRRKNSLRWLFKDRELRIFYLMYGLIYLWKEWLI